MKTALKRENNESLVITLKHVSILTSHANPPETPKLWAIAHENGHKTRKRRVFGHNSQTCIGLKVVVNIPGTPKQWAIAHENGIKTRNKKFLVITLKHASGLTGHANRPEDQKLWAIAHENGPKTQKQRNFGPNSQTCTGSYKPCKSP